MEFAKAPALDHPDRNRLAILAIHPFGSEQESARLAGIETGSTDVLDLAWIPPKILGFDLHSDWAVHADPEIILFPPLPQAGSS